MGLWQRITRQGTFLPLLDNWRTATSRSKQRLSSVVIANSIKRFTSLFLIGVSLSLAIAACGGGNGAGGQGGDVQLNLVSFAVTKAPHDEIIPLFVKNWQQQHNQNVTFNQSYGGSGTQARAVIDGLEADIVHLALALDVERIEQAGLIEPGWEKEAPYGGIVTKSVAALVTREGNPKGIKTWADLAKDDVSVITANPKTSGGARWNFLGLWGSVTQTGGDDAKAQQFADQVFANTPVLPRDARESTDVFFKQGQGDVLINYENEMILAEQQGQKVPYVVPEVNISIDNPVAVVDENVDRRGTREVAEAFVEFLYTPEAQKIFAKYGFRPVEPSVGEEVAEQFPKIATLFTAQDMGGWDEIQKKFFEDGAIFDKIQASK